MLESKMYNKIGSTTKKKTYRHREQTGGYQSRYGRGTIQGWWNGKCKLLNVR